MKKNILIWGLWIFLLVIGTSTSYEIGDTISENKKSLQGIRKTLQELDNKIESKTYNFDNINVTLQGLRTSINDINTRLDSNDDRFRTSVGEINDILQELDELLNAPVEEPVAEETGANAGFGELSGTLATGNGGEGILSIGVSEPVENTEPITISEYIPPKRCTVPKTNVSLSDFTQDVYLTRPLEFIAEFDLRNGEPINFVFTGSSNRDTRKAVTRYINAIDFGTETINGCKIPFKFTF
jgi:hypothetical protein